MMPNTRPVYGFRQPALGSPFNLQSITTMSTTRRKSKVPGFMREVLADNVKRLMVRHYKESGSRPRALAKDAGVSLSTIQRILAREVGATIDNIESVAGVFHLSAYQILVPMLDVRNPQIIKGATLDEQRLYRMLRQAKISGRPVGEFKT